MVSALFLYELLIGATAIERLVELRLSLRHAAWSRAQGGYEVGHEHYPAMVTLHAAFLVGCAVEPWLRGLEFDPWLGLPMLLVAALMQALRWWCIRTLGTRWNTRVIIVPGLPRVTSGPYRWLNHPNYVAVIAEGVALPMIFGATFTAIAFSILNAALLTVRIRAENAALATLDAPQGSHSEIQP